MKTKTTLRDVYSRPGFRARARFKCGIKGDPRARVILLERRQKKASAPVAGGRALVSTTIGSIVPETWMPGSSASSWTSNTGA